MWTMLAAVAVALVSPCDARPAAGRPAEPLLRNRFVRTPRAGGLPQAGALPRLSLHRRDHARHAAALRSPHRRRPELSQWILAANRARACSGSWRRSLGVGGIRSERTGRARRMVRSVRDSDRFSDQRRQGEAVRRAELRARAAAGGTPVAYRRT